MIWLENEKRFLWQWDVNQHIFTDEDAPVIHFRYGDGVIQVPISDGTAKIPDVLLQTAGSIRLYLYDGEGTLRHAAFPVRSRPKPPGYVYTEEETQTWDNLVGRMEKIEGSLDANIELANNASQLLTQMQESEEAAKKASEDASAAAAAAENSATPRINEVAYAAGDNGTTPPTESGSWGAVIPSVPQGQFLWTRVTNTYISGKTEVSYSVARMGMDGSGSVSSVNEVSPDSNGNVTLSADDIGALPTSGGTMTGPINMNGQSITGLNPPTEDTQAVNKGYLDGSVRKAAPRNLLDNSDFRNPVNQSGIGGSHGSIAYAADRWILDSGTVSYKAGVGLTLNGTIRQKLEFPPTGETSAFVGIASGDASISCADGEVTIISSGGVLKWAALYPGEYTAETLPEYQPKGYGAELVECMRYYQRVDGYYLSGKNTTVRLSPPMRVKPTIDGYIQKYISGEGWVENPEATISASSVNSVRLYAGAALEYAHNATFEASADM